MVGKTKVDGRVVKLRGDNGRGKVSEHNSSIGRNKTEKRKILPVPTKGLKKHKRTEDLVYEHHKSPLLFCG